MSCFLFYIVVGQYVELLLFVNLMKILYVWKKLPEGTKHRLAETIDANHSYRVTEIILLKLFKHLLFVIFTILLLGLTNIKTMLDVKYNIKGLVSSIYECQKKIILNRRFIREMESEGKDTQPLEMENMKLEDRISEFQKELKKKYQFTY